MIEQEIKILSKVNLDCVAQPSSCSPLQEKDPNSKESNFDTLLVIIVQETARLAYKNPSVPDETSMEIPAASIRTAQGQ